MKKEPGILSSEKENLHPRNKHRSRYNFKELVAVCKELTQYVKMYGQNNETIDFSDPKAVRTLNKALLKKFYDISFWEIPANYLSPGIPGRADYIHYAADLLASCNDGVIPAGHTVRVLDIGVGANCVYPMIGKKEYGWHFTGSDTDPVAIQSVKKISTSNPVLTGGIDCRLQENTNNIFKGIIKTGERFDLVICNPPFHTSAEAAAAGTTKKIKNLRTGKKGERVLNFGGQSNELWCVGGEASFVYRMILESAEMPQSCFWFTTLISDKNHLPAVYKILERAGVSGQKTIDMSQGQKKSRIVAWTFLTKEQQHSWRQARWL